MSSVPSGTVTFLFTDIEGSTKLAQSLGDKWESLRARHHEILKSAIESNNGYVFQIIGDAFCASFHNAGDALHAAAQAQIDFHNEDWGEMPVKIRIGINTGTAQASIDTDHSGGYKGYTAMARVQRIMSAGHGGQILLSGATHELVRDSLPDNTEILSLGEKRLKDLARPEHLYQLSIAGLITSFPPLKTLDSFSNNLPTQLTPFIGREREIAAVLGLIRNPDVHLVTLVGPGGTGKTRLSLQIAAEVIDEFQHGVWFVDLSPITNPDRVIPEIANTLGLQESADEPLETTLFRYLSSRSMLLVLDNYEQVITAAHMAGKMLTGAPHLKVLITSRETLQVYGEHSYQVPSLTVPDLHRKETAEVVSQYEAVSLFIQRAKAVMSSFEVNNDNAPAVAEICVRLDGLPLAIELAAARITLFPPQQLLQRLGDRLKTVSGGQRDLPTRQRTLRAAIDWSYDLLSDDEKILFARLSVFQGGRTLDAAEAVCSEGLEIEVADGLESLIHKSLLRQTSGSTDEPRYVMLETIHEYARERLAASQEGDAIRLRHVEYFVQLVKRVDLHGFDDIPERWLLILRDEQDNILTALEWSLGGGAVKEGVNLAIIIGAFWIRDGRYSLNIFWKTRALQHKDALSREMRAQLLGSTGSAFWYVSDMERARQLHLQALDLFRELGYTRNTGWTLTGLAGTTMGQPELYTQAKTWFDEGLAIAVKIGDKRDEANAHLILGEIARSVGDYATAKKAYEDSLPPIRQIGNRLLENYTLANFSQLYAHEGDYRRAYEFALQALNLGIEIDSKYIITESLHIVARAIGSLGQPERASRLYGASEALREKLGSRIQAGDLADYENGLANVRARLDSAKFEALWAEGRAMDMEQVIAYALDDFGNNLDPKSQAAS